MFFYNIFFYPSFLFLSQLSTRGQHIVKMFDYINPRNFEFSQVNLTCPSLLTTQFSNFVKMAVIGSVSECLDQLFILRNIKGREYISNFTEDVVVYENLSKRFMGIKDHGQTRLNLQTSNYEKLAKDMNLIINVLRASLKEFYNSNSILILETCTDAIRRMSEDDQALMKEVTSNERLVEELQNKIEEEKTSKMNMIQSMEDEIQKLKFTLEDVRIYGSYETAYFKMWETARREQNAMSCEYKEDVHRDSIKDSKIKISQEERCHSEIVKYSENAIEDYKDDINYWMRKNDLESEERDMQLMQMKLDLEKMTKDFSDTQETYYARQIEMQNWLAYKKAKEEKEAMEALILSSILKIQWWWRMIMFKRKLGPYRKKKKKGKDDKKKKKL